MVEASKQIVAGAAENTRSDIVKMLLEERVLEALFAEGEAQDLEGALLLLTQWLRRAFGLERDTGYKAGQRLRVQAESLQTFDLGDGVVPASGAVSIQVEAAGWKRDGNWIVRPVVTLVNGSLGSGPASR
jgi:hypothetical protein